MSEGSLQTNLEKAKKLTQEAAARVDSLVFSFGHLSDGCPEREILQTKVREVLSDWAEKIWDCGAQPQELWTVVFKTPQGPISWKYPCSQFSEKL